MVSSPDGYPTGVSMAGTLGLPKLSAAVWMPTLNKYVLPPTAPADTFRVGQGYWIDLSQVVWIEQVGAPAASSQNFSISLQPGWNMIGDPFGSAIPMSSVTVTPAGSTTSVPYATAVQSGLVSILYTWQPGDTAYELISPTASMQPWLGYWIYSKSFAQLTVPPPTRLEYSYHRRPPHSGGLDPSAGAGAA